MSISVQMMTGIACVIIFRIMLSRFCDQVENRKRLLCVVGMMLSYTAIILLMINMAASDLIAKGLSVKEFSIYVSILVLTVNIIFGFIILMYYSTARKRSLSNREKIMLKDL